MEIDTEKKKEITRIAQVNEYMYSVLKEQGVVMNIDEDVGFQFFNVP